MPDVRVHAADSFGAQAGRRWQAVDPLLPVPGTLRAGCGVCITAAGPEGQPTATATCHHSQAAPGFLSLTFGAACIFRLDARIAGPDVAGPLDELLSRWRGHLARVADFGGDDTSALVTWPSRDIGGGAALLRHGLAPLSVVAARTAGRHPARDPGESARNVLIRRATPDDIDAIVQLGLETIRFDAQAGGVIERRQTPEALRRRAGGLLAGSEPWTWVAERDGMPVGMVCTEPPESAGWIAPMTAAAPVAYILMMSVAASERGNGVGAALATRAHREIDAAGVAVTLLHHSLSNPLAVPFWGAQGYRPLWTIWEARPARTVR